MISQKNYVFLKLSIIKISLEFTQNQDIFGTFFFTFYSHLIVITYLYFLKIISIISQKNSLNSLKKTLIKNYLQFAQKQDIPGIFLLSPYSLYFLKILSVIFQKNSKYSLYSRSLCNQNTS